jgi:hypothetical protein
LLYFSLASESPESEKTSANVAIRLGENFLKNFIQNSSSKQAQILMTSEALDRNNVVKGLLEVPFPERNATARGSH